MTTAKPERTEGATPPPETERAPSPPDATESSAAPPTLRSALVVPGITLVVAVLLLVGGVMMRVPESAAYMGPDFFPLTVGAILALTGLVSGARAVWTVHGTREDPPGNTARGKAPDTEAGREAAESEGARTGDWPTLGIMAATLTAHVLLLQPLGWLIAGTLLFWGISFALDRGKPLMDLFVAVALSAIVQICFSGLLDVALPLGVLGKVP